MAKTITDRVAQYLLANGPTPTPTLAKVLKLNIDQVTGCVCKETTAKRFGFFRAGRAPAGPRGRKPLIIGVDPELYAASKVKPKPKKKTKSKAKRPTPKLPKVDYSHKAPVYNGPHRTVWQPTSPYFKGAINADQSSSPSTPAV